MVVHVQFWWLESVNWFSLSFFPWGSFDLHLVQDFGSQTEFYHQTSGFWPKGRFPHLLKKYSVSFKGWMQHAIQLDFSCPFAERMKERSPLGMKSICTACLPLHWLRSYQESYSIGACLEDEALGLQSGHAWIPVKAEPSCSQMQHLCTHRAHQGLQALWQADKRQSLY